MIEKLLEYQEIDKGLRQIELDIISNEARKKAMVAKKFISGVNDMIVSLDTKASGLNENLLRLEKEYSKLKEKEQDYSDAMIEECQSFPELEFYKKNATALQKQITKIAKDINQINDEMQSLLAEYSSILKKNKMFSEQFKENQPIYAEFKKQKDKEKAPIINQLEELKSGIDENWFKRYENKRKDKVFPVLVPVNDKYCGACGTDLSMLALGKLQKDGYLECENCRKLIYIPIVIEEKKPAKRTSKAKK